MKKLSEVIRSCSPIIQLIGFFTWDVFAFLLADTVSLLAMLFSEPAECN
jgi:hypothetical protein